MDTKSYFLWISLLFTTASALVGYDCGRKASNVTTISLREVAPCELQDSNPEITNIEMQLLQRLEYEAVQVTLCRIKVDRHIHRCGMFSHQMEVLMGEETFLFSISRDACQDIHRFGTFAYERVMIHDIKVNTTTRASIVIAGSLSEDGKCSGTEFKTGVRDYNEVVATAKLEIEILDYTASANQNKNELILKSGTRCNFKDTKCTDADGRRAFWEYAPPSPCNYRQYVQLFDGEGVKVGNDTIENPNVYFANTTEKIQFGLVKTGEITLCGYHIFSTDHPKLFITEYPREKGIPAAKSLNVNDILLSAYFNTKIAYLAHHMKAQFLTMYNDILLHRCKLQRQVIQNSLMHMYSKPDMAALTIMRKPGYMAVPVGEVAHLIACEEIFCKVRKIEECFQEIPVTCRNESFFLKPFSRIMVKTATPRTCNNILPAVYLLEESWLKFSPKPEEARTPQILQPQTTPSWRYQDVKGLIEGGIYTDDDLNRLHKHSIFPAERQAYIEEVARRLSDKGTYSSSFDFGNLIDQTTLQSMVENTFKRFWTGFTEFGVFCAGMMGVITAFTILKLIVDTLIHGYTLHSIYGWSIHLLGAIWGSITYLLVTLAKQSENEINDKKLLENNEVQKYLNNEPALGCEASSSTIKIPSAPVLLEMQEQPENMNTFMINSTKCDEPTVIQVASTNQRQPENMSRFQQNSPRSNELEKKLFQYFNKRQIVYEDDDSE